MGEMKRREKWLKQCSRVTNAWNSTTAAVYLHPFRSNHCALKFELKSIFLKIYLLSSSCYLTDEIQRDVILSRRKIEEI